MRAALIQRNMKILEQVISGLHEEYDNLRKSRKMYNERADECFRQMMITDDQLDFDASHQHKTEGEANREQAAIFTPYIKKFAKKIAKLQEVQKALKLEAKDAARIDAWLREDDAFWLQQVEIPKGSGIVTYDYDELAKMFGDE